MERCPHCGVKIYEGSKKCGFCGAPLDVQGGMPPRFSPMPELYNLPAFDSLLLTPVFGSWCSWRDARTLGNKELEKVALIAMPIFAVLVIASAVIFFSCVLPGMTRPKSGRRLIGLIGAVNLIPWIGYYFIVHKPQADFIKEHDIAYREKSCFLPALIAFVLCVAAGVTIAVIVNLSDD